MRIIFGGIFLLVFGFPCFVAAQIGLHAGIRLNDAPDWNILDRSNGQVTEVPGSSWSAGIDYAIKLRKVRIEFLPELNYSMYEVQVRDLGPMDARFFNGFFNIHIYPLDLKGDCECPTFVKKGNSLAKGFFIQLSPGYTYFKGEIDSEAVLYRGWSTNPSMAAGIGLDLGISRFLTLTPLAGLRYYPNVIWPGIEEALARDISIGDRAGSNESALTQIYAGIRLGLNLRGR